jgi:hypothetical protein
MTLAAAVGAFLLVSADADLTTLSPWRGRSIIEPSQFAALVDGSRRARRRRRRQPSPAPVQSRRERGGQRKVLDTLRLSRRLLPCLPGYRLGARIVIPSPAVQSAALAADRPGYGAEPNANSKSDSCSTCRLIIAAKGYDGSVSS